MAFEHPSGLSGAYDRTPQRLVWSEVIARDSRQTDAPGYLAQAADINESQSIMRRRVKRVGDMIGRDGDRVAGAAVAVAIDDEEELTGTINLAEGLIYAAGDVRSVAARTITAVALAGEVTVGIRLATTYVTEEDDPDLKGLHPGSLGEGEPGSARAIETATWALSTEAGAGQFFSVYLLRDGTPIDQTPPPSLTGINQALAQYDRGSNGGNYIVTGCRVTALGIESGNAAFSIEAGEANIFGFKRTREHALRHVQALDWETETIAAEPHTFADGGTGTAILAVNHGPIDAINSVIITKQVTETVVRGTPSGTSDTLGHTGVTEILSVTQGATTFDEGADYLQDGDRVSWAPGGAEPATGSSYDVTYRYLASVVPSAVTADTFTVSGGVTGSAVTVGYDWRLPRIDLLCLDQSGNSVYLKGAPARERPVPPIAPVTLLALCEIHHDWRGTPAVVNNGIRAVHFDLLWRYLNRVVDLLDLVALERLKSDIDSREPVAKRGVFVDPFTSDYYRDQGEAQTAAIFAGSLQLAIDPTFHPIAMEGPIMLPYVEEVIISQPLVTGCIKINPYANFDPLPGKLALTPSQDFWTVSQTEWLSAQTRQISGTSNRTTVTDEVVDEREELLEFLREIEIAFTVSGLGHGEEVTELLFDGIDVTPDPALEGDEDGEASGAFTIPANVTAGSKLVEATGASGMKAYATFVGEGRVDITTMRRTTLVEVAPVPIVRRTRQAQGLSNNGQKIGDGADPQAQTFAPLEPRHILGMDFRICAVGSADNPVAAELHSVETGLPTTEVLASALLPMAGVAAGDWIEARWPAPAFITADRLSAFVLKTDDAVHSVSIADVGGYDDDADAWVGAQPYTAGDRLDGSNGVTWLPHPGSDLTFRAVAAKFTATTRTVELGTIALVDCSDLLIAATVELPTAECAFHFEVVRADSSVIQLAPYQVHEFSEYVSETVTLRAVLTGTEKVSPTLFPGAMVIAGKIRETGTYVTRAFTFGTDIRLPVRFKALLPAGSSVTVEYDLADDDWTVISLTSSEALNDGWAERLHEVEDVTGFEGRLRLTLNGGPAARLSLADLRATSI